ncbi:MAG: leucine-rich repeat domain-containing protein [Candidatus Kariarchaeaceae archaeon]|jgi:Leucine-rich repeat (LRR) protein
MSDEVAVNINIDDKDASFIKDLREAGAEVLFLGEYLPEYSSSTDMKSLTWSQASPLSDFRIDLGFTVHSGQISALYLDLREMTPEIYAAVAEAIINLDYVMEIILGLNENQEMIDVGHLSKLQYLEIIKERSEMEFPEISGMKDLTVLVISGKVGSVPDLSTNKELQRLVLRSTSVEKFPSSITKLKKLVWLELGDQFDALPDKIVELQDLVVLDLISDNLTYLPDDLGKLSKLQHVSIETDKITELPSTFNQLRMLTDLYLWNFPIEEVPLAVCELINLRYFWMKENSKLRGALLRIPREIGNLVNLVDLQLNGHEIEKIPATISKLQKLKTLNLGINSIKSLPKKLTKLRELTRLELYYNPITELPDNIGDLESLEYLDISDTKITLIPESIAKIRNLQDFDAIGCELNGLPESISGWNFTKFRSFMITLRDDPKNLPTSVQKWLEKLIRYADENEEKGIEIDISLFVPEFEE